MGQRAQTFIVALSVKTPQKFNEKTPREDRELPREKRVIFWAVDGLVIPRGRRLRDGRSRERVVPREEGQSRTSVLGKGVCKGEGEGHQRPKMAKSDHQKKIERKKGQCFFLFLCVFQLSFNFVCFFSHAPTHSTPSMAREEGTKLEPNGFCFSC